MRILGKILLAIILFIGLMAATSFLLPRQIEVSRDIQINAPAEKIFPYVNDLKKFNEWSPWAKIDPKTKYKFKGPDSGVGQSVRWSSKHDQVRTGTQTIVKSDPNKSVETALDFGDMGKAKARFRLTPSGNGTSVSWDFETNAGNNPIMRWMGLMFDKWIGADYEKGLKSLKELIEQA